MPHDAVATAARVPRSARDCGGLISVVIVGSFLLGVFGPTSVDGRLRPLVAVAYSGVAVAVLVFLRLAMPLPTPAQMLALGLFGGGLLLGTALSPFAGQYSPGLVPSFVGVALLLIATPVELPKRATAALHRAIRWSGIAYAAWATGILLTVPVIQDITIKYYPAYYQELVKGLVVLLHHPVAAWGTHSAAALIFFLFALYFRHDAVTTGRLSSTLLAMFWVGALFSLRSFSGLFLGLWALILLLNPWLVHVPHYTSRFLAHRLGRITVVVVVAAIIVLWRPVIASVQSVLGLDVSGFSGRYSEGSGRIYQTVAWIRDHPLSPIGFTETESLVFGDSAYIDYFLRGSLLTVIGTYLGLVVTVRRFLGSSRLGLHLALAIVAFDLGFSALPLWRLQLIWVPLLLGIASITPPSQPARKVDTDDHHL
jgi:hypothetical protein